MRIAVAGTRSRPATANEAKAFRRLRKKLDGSVLLHGCCPATGTPKTDGVPERMRGIDGWIEERAQARGIAVEHFPPLQLTIGWPGCGPERSRRMVAASDAVILFEGGVGTARTRGFALEMSKPLYEIFPDENDWVGPCPCCGEPGDGYGCSCASD